MVKSLGMLAPIFGAGFCCVCALVSCAPDQMLEASPFEGRRIGEIVIRQKGAGGTWSNRVRSIVEPRMGKTFSEARIDEAIKVAYESGLVDEIHIFAQEKRKGLTLIVEVKDRPPMGPGGFIGNTAFSDARLGKVAELQGVKSVGGKAIKAGGEKIEAYYRQYGYDLVKVSGVCPPGMGVSEAWRKGAFRFRIEEGPRVGR